VAGVPRTGVRGMLLLWPFQASANAFKSTTKERRSVAAQHTVSDKAAQLCSAPSSNRGASHDIAIQDAEEGA
jgi:hypothetical protein